MKKKKVLAVLGLAAVVAAGGTLAYYNADHSAVNEFDTGTYSTTMEEVFNPKDGDNWEPGVTVNKDVIVRNNSTDNSVVVRAKLDEAWSRKNEKNESVSFKTIAYDENSGDKITNVYQESATDGEVANDNTVVAKEINTTDWIKGSDGWYYYKALVPAGGETSKFLDSVQLASNVDMGQFAKSYTVLVDGTETVVADAASYMDATTGKVNLEALSDALGLKKGQELKVQYNNNITGGKLGYSGADYALTITSEVVQATDGAVKEKFADENGAFTAPTGVNWDLTTETPTEAPAQK